MLKFERNFWLNKMLILLELSWLSIFEILKILILNFFIFEYLNKETHFSVQSSSWSVSKVQAFFPLKSKFDCFWNG